MSKQTKKIDKKTFEQNYKGHIPKGVFKQVSVVDSKELNLETLHYDTSRDVSVLNTEGDKPVVARFGSFQTTHYAAFTEDLINAYFNGDLVWAEDVKAKEEEEEEGCQGC